MRKSRFKAKSKISAKKGNQTIEKGIISFKCKISEIVSKDWCSSQTIWEESWNSIFSGPQGMPSTKFRNCVGKDTEKVIKGVTKLVPLFAKLRSQRTRRWFFLGSVLCFPWVEADFETSGGGGVGSLGMLRAPSSRAARRLLSSPNGRPRPRLPGTARRY